MKRLLEWVQGFALALGGPGLGLIALLDSSFLSFPQVVDVLIVILVTKHKALVLYYPLLATLGSMAGCFALYWLGRRGGEAFLRKRLHDRHVDRTVELFQKYGLLSIAIPSILPPPFPLKPFVIAAGVARVRPIDFALAVALGRGFRYFGEAVLALWYGDKAATFLRDHTRAVSLVIAAVVLVLAIVGTWWMKTRTAR
jgi:membrane protein YqaA with SNARE-associated domain